MQNLCLQSERAKRENSNSCSKINLSCALLDNGYTIWLQKKERERPPEFGEVELTTIQRYSILVQVFKVLQY